MRPFRKAGVWIFLILFGTYAYFWQSRDWNTASRLMLTYSIVDRGTIALNGLEKQTGDLASFRGGFYTDKLPGFSLLATVPYALARLAFQLPPHPRFTEAMPYWPADYWVTLGTSGLFSAMTGVLLVGLARDLGCGPRRSALVALAYGLATPAYLYATLSYGHQVSAYMLLAAFALIWRTGGRRPTLPMIAAGFLASYASVIELQVGPVSALLGFYLLAQVLGGLRRPMALGEFFVGAVVPALVLLGYNQLAFGSPWDMGYFHHATREFAEVHNEKNPLGLVGPDASRAWGLLWGRHRGLLFYAPVVALVPPGLLALASRKFWGAAVMSSAVMSAVFTVNLCYPEWTGGWSTGPRLLVPLLPFAMIAVAGWLAHGGRPAVWAVSTLALGGGVVLFLCVAVGGRFPPEFPDPIVEIVWPLWMGRPLAGKILDIFAINPTTLIFVLLTGHPVTGARGLTFAPLVLAQLLAIGLMMRSLRPASSPSNLRVDQEQDDRRQHEDAKDPGAGPKRVLPDLRP